MGKKFIETCPISIQTPPARIDDDGWCHEHGWDCDDDNAVSPITRISAPA